MAVPYADVVAWNNAEGGTDMTTVTSGNSGGASGASMSPAITGSSTVRFEAAGAIHDGLSYHLVGSGGSAAVRFLASTLGALTRCCGTVYLKLDALPSGYTDFIGAYSSDSGGTVNKGWAIRISGSGAVRLMDAASTSNVFSSTEQLAANTVYRLEWDIDHSTGAYKVEWFAGDEDAALASYTGTAANGFLAQTSRLDIGRMTSPDLSVWVDSIAVDTKPTGKRIVPAASFGPVDVVSNSGGYTAVGGGTLVGVVRDNSDATYIESPVEPNSAVIVYEMAPHSRQDTVTVTYRDWRSDAAATVTTTLELIDLDTEDVLGDTTYTATTTPTDYQVVSDAPVPTTVRLGVRITTDTGV